MRNLNTAFVMFLLQVMKNGGKHSIHTKEYALIKWEIVFYKLLLNELGSKGWELICKNENPYYDDIINNNMVSVTTLTLKRSSHSKFFGTGEDVDTKTLYELAREKVRADYKPHGEILDKEHI